MNDIIGTNDEGLNNLTLEIRSYKDEISNIFNSLEDSVVNLRDSYKCEAGSVFDQKFNNLKRNFPILKNNLDTYADDLIRAKDNHSKVDLNSVRTIEQAISNIKDVTNKNLL